MIKSGGSKAGIVFNPSTPLTVLDEVMELVDLVLIMSVNPGFGGQQFIETSLSKLREAREIIDRSGKSIRLEIDGGINTNNIAQASSAGADTFVAGTAIFGSDNYAETITEMKKAIIEEQ